MARVRKANNVAKRNEMVFRTIMGNLKQVGNKYYASISTEGGFLFADERFQRAGLPSSIKKIKALASKWDIKKMDALRVVPHKEECRFSVVDGYHRLEAAKIVGETELVCEIIMDISDDPIERLVQEATLFATQKDEVDNLTPIEKHNANVLRGVKANVDLHELVTKYNIPLKKNPTHGRVKIGALAGFTAALRNIEINNGKQIMDNVFYVICNSRWNIAPGGFSANAINALASMYKLHPVNAKEITEALIEFCKPIEPDKLFASAMDKYPERRTTERNVLYLEDYLCEKLGIARVYFGGNVIPVNVEEKAA